jgi:hypothetical protein
MVLLFKVTTGNSLPNIVKKNMTPPLLDAHYLLVIEYGTGFGPARKRIRNTVSCRIQELAYPKSLGRGLNSLLASMSPPQPELRPPPRPSNLKNKTLARVSCKLEYIHPPPRRGGEGWRSAEAILGGYRYLKMRNIKRRTLKGLFHQIRNAWTWFPSKALG